MKKNKIPHSIRFVAIILFILPDGCFQKCHAQSKLYCINAETTDNLHDLFKYKNDGVYFLSSHRGGPEFTFSENCIETFQHTLKHTYSIIECDPRYTKDSVIILHHDQTLDRTTNGHGKVSDYTFQEIKKLVLKDIRGNETAAKIPTLDEALQWAKGKTILVLDKKDVPIEKRVQKITEHKAEAWAMVIAYNYKEAKKCYELNHKIMMEIFINSPDQFAEFGESGIPWENVVVFVGHSEPDDSKLFDLIHQKGALCMQGTSRNLDKIFNKGEVAKIEELRAEYLTLFQKGVDIIETDIPVPLSRILPEIPKNNSTKSNYFSTN